MQKNNGNWIRIYLEAKKYYEKYGNLLVPKNYIVKVDNNFIDLSDWLKRQKVELTNLDSIKRNLLDNINMCWYYDMNATLEERWNMYFSLAKKYYEEHKNLLIPQSYVVVDGSKKINLGIWIYVQRRNKNALSSEKIKLLEEIDMVWNALEYKKIDKYLEEQYLLYQKGQLNENEVDKLLSDGIFVYSDLDNDKKIEKASTLELYRKGIK